MLEREGERDTLVSRTEQRCNRDPRRLRRTRSLEDGLSAGHRLADNRPGPRPEATQRDERSNPTGYAAAGVGAIAC